MQEGSHIFELFLIMFYTVFLSLKERWHTGLFYFVFVLALFSCDRKNGPGLFFFVEYKYETSGVSPYPFLEATVGYEKVRSDAFKRRASRHLGEFLIMLLDPIVHSFSYSNCLSFKEQLFACFFSFCQRAASVKVKNKKKSDVSDSKKYSILRGLLLCTFELWPVF